MRYWTAMLLGADATGRRCYWAPMKDEPLGALFRHMPADAAIVIKNFRPGTFQCWCLGCAEQA
jgi:hypothetical protein